MLLSAATNVTASVYICIVYMGISRSSKRAYFSYKLGNNRLEISFHIPAHTRDGQYFNYIVIS